MIRKLTQERNRSRISYSLLILAVMGLGLGSRRFDFLLPAMIRKSTGDVVWALMVFLLCGFLFPRLSTLRAGLGALAFSIEIECSKFYHAPWLDPIRDTSLGRLVFGYVFSWSNLGCYLLGVLIGVLLEIVALPATGEARYRPVEST
jgi:hypothetical protein